MKNSNVNINISSNAESKNSKFNLFKMAFNYISNAKWESIFKVYFVTFFFLATALAAFYGYNVVSDKEIVKETTKKLMDEQREENIRDNIVTPKIQHELDILVYSLNADRAFIFELHNGKKNTSGLPFRFADMTYEEVNEERKIDKVAMQFQNIPLTLYKYPHYLQKQKIMIGTVDEIEEIDAEYAKHIKDVGGKYLGMVYINGNGVPLGFLCVSYHDIENVPSRATIENKLTEYGQMMKHLLDLEAHINVQ